MDGKANDIVARQRGLTSADWQELEILSAEFEYAFGKLERALFNLPDLELSEAEDTLLTSALAVRVFENGDRWTILSERDKSAAVSVIECRLANSRTVLDLLFSARDYDLGWRSAAADVRQISGGGALAKSIGKLHYTPAAEVREIRRQAATAALAELEIDSSIGGRLSRALGRRDCLSEAQRLPRNLTTDDRLDRRNQQLLRAETPTPREVATMLEKNRDILKLRAAVRKHWDERHRQRAPRRQSMTVYPKCGGVLHLRRLDLSRAISRICEQEGVGHAAKH